jgi:serine/threonine protein kinase
MGSSTSTQVNNDISQVMNCNHSNPLFLAFQVDASTTTPRSRSHSSIALPSSRVHQISASVGSAEIELIFKQNYEFVRILGRGASAEVHLIRDKDTAIEYACKIVRKSSMNDSGTMATESLIMKKLQDKHLLSLHEIYETQDTLWMVLEFADGGDLMHGLSSLPVYNERNIAKVFQQLLLGVQYLHSQGIVHRDLKMDNLLYSKAVDSSEKSLETDEETKDSQDSFPIDVKIADFGLSTFSTKRNAQNSKSLKSLKEHKEMWGTMEYFAPEMYHQSGYGPQVDIWALGCILFEMLTGEICFPNRELTPTIQEKMMTVAGLHKKIRSFELKDGWKDLSPAAQSLIKGMLKRNPTRRFDIDECLQHPWIKNLETMEMSFAYDHELKVAKKIVSERAQRRVRRYQLLVNDMEKEAKRNKTIVALLYIQK